MCRLVLRGVRMGWGSQQQTGCIACPEPRGKGGFDRSEWGSSPSAPSASSRPSHTGAGGGGGHNTNTSTHMIAADHPEAHALRVCGFRMTNCGGSTAEDETPVSPEVTAQSTSVPMAPGANAKARGFLSTV